MEAVAVVAVLAYLGFVAYLRSRTVESDPMAEFYRANDRAMRWTSTTTTETTKPRKARKR